VITKSLLASLLTSSNSFRRSAIGEIKREAFEPTIGTIFGELFVLDVDDGGKIDLDPAQRLRQLHAVRSRVEAGAEIEDGVDPLRDRLLDKIVNDDSADHDIPAKIDRESAFVHRSVVFPCQLAGQRVAEQRPQQLAPRARQAATRNAVSATLFIAGAMSNLRSAVERKAGWVA
jgi:hypothetical protein